MADDGNCKKRVKEIGEDREKERMETRREGERGRGKMRREEGDGNSAGIRAATIFQGLPSLAR